MYFVKYTPIALTLRGTACLAEYSNGKLLEMGYFATIACPPNIYKLKEKRET